MRWTRTSPRSSRNSRRLGLSEDTILVFTSDNGAMEAGSSLPLRGHKHTIYDGGVRLPTVIHWPRGGLVGGRKWGGLCGALDMFPTLMAMTGSAMPQTRPLDGKDIWPALRDDRPSPVESYYWVWRDEDAIRTQRWKLHRFFDRYELYDINMDETESINVAEAHPDVVGSLVGPDGLLGGFAGRRDQSSARAGSVSHGPLARWRGACRHGDRHREVAAQGSPGHLGRELEWHAIRHRLDRVRHRLLAPHDRAASLLLDTRREQLETLRSAVPARHGRGSVRA